MSSKTPYNDKTLALQLKRGDKKAFEVIFNQYKTKLYFFALSYIHTQVEAEEIVQNAFVSLWEHRLSLDETLSVKNYLYKTIVNNVYNYLKHEAVKRRYNDYTYSETWEEDDYSQNNIHFNDLEQTIGSLIEDMPIKQQKIFKMSRWEGLSHGEIAAQLGLSVRSVENHVHRALKFLKEHLREEYLMVLLIPSFSLFFL